MRLVLDPRQRLGGLRWNSPDDDREPTYVSDGAFTSRSTRPGGGAGNSDLDPAHSIDGSVESLVTLPNTERWEAGATLAPNGDYLVYSVDDVPGALGAADLYVSWRTADGTWTAPTNLGPAVNSPSFDFAPQFTPDGATLLLNCHRSGNHDVSFIPVPQVPALRRP